MMITNIKRMNMKKLYSSISLIILSMTSLCAQSAIVPTGGDMEGSGITISYTIGQIAVQS